MTKRDKYGTKVKLDFDNGDVNLSIDTKDFRHILLVLPKHIARELAKEIINQTGGLKFYE